MTEHRPPYHAESGTTQADKRALSISDLLVQRSLDGTISRDSILLLPILQTGQNDGTPEVCLHLVHLENGMPGFCLAASGETCFCCNCPVCREHLSPDRLPLPRVHGVTHTAPLCKTCATFPRQTISALHEFRRLINSRGQVQS
jgi:hypothetical protein